jgi:hypothetical protein
VRTIKIHCCAVIRFPGRHSNPRPSRKRIIKINKRTGQSDGWEMIRYMEGATLHSYIVMYLWIYGSVWTSTYHSQLSAFGISTELPKVGKPICFSKFPGIPTFVPISDSRWHSAGAARRRVFLLTAVRSLSLMPITSKLIFRTAHATGRDKRSRSWLRHCATRRKVAGSIPDGVTGIFYWHTPSDRTMALGLNQPQTKMSTKNISWGVKVAGA